MRDGDYKSHGCRYRFDGEWYFLTLKATSQDDAKRRVGAARIGTLRKVGKPVEKGDIYRPHTFDFTYQRKLAQITVIAINEEDARDRMRAAEMNGEFDQGCIHFRLPVMPMWLAVPVLNAITGLLNLWSRLTGNKP